MRAQQSGFVVDPPSDLGRGEAPTVTWTGDRFAVAWQTLEDKVWSINGMHVPIVDASEPALSPAADVGAALAFRGSDRWLAWIAPI